MKKLTIFASVVILAVVVYYVRFVPNRRFSAAEIPRMDSKVAIVTGGNTGLGYVTVKEMARAGAHVIMACRSEERATAAIKKIQSELAAEGAAANAGAIMIEFLPLDLASLASVRAFTTAFRAKALPLHVLGTVCRWCCGRPTRALCSLSAYVGKGTDCSGLRR